jgi:predicted anti-sigma-YlaC factor YlaD
MDCGTARAAISATLDGERPEVDGDELASHLDTCADCRRWRELAHEVTRRSRLVAAQDVPAAPQALVARAKGARHARRVARDLLWTRVALLAVGAAQLTWVAAPALLGGTDHDAPIHVSHEMGSFEVAVAAGLLLASWLPARAQGMRVLVGAAALLLVVTAIVDIAAGRTTIGDEAPHLLCVTGWLLLRHLAELTPGSGGARPSLGAMLARARPGAGHAGRLSDELGGDDPLISADHRRENVAA